MRSVIHELRVLQGIVGEALDELEELYTNPPQDDARAKAMDFPSLNKMYDPNTAEEAMTATPEVARAISLIVAAASQLSASVQHPFLTICDAATAYHLPACLRVFEACGAVELMKEAGEKGVSIETIAENCPGGKVDSRRLAHIFRLLATHHIIIEVSPGDVFALNRISGCLVTHPEPSPASAALRKPEDKYVDTNGIAAYIGLCTDELFKASAYLLESLLVRPQYEMDEECSPAHKIEAEETESEEREQEFRLARFGRAMTGTTSIEGYGGIWNALDWLALPKGSLVVDVGGGIGSTSVMLARGGMKDMGARFIVQDRGAVCKLGEEVCTVFFSCAIIKLMMIVEHDFFTPQPEHLKGPAVYLLRVVLHDWADPLCRKILLRLRQAVIPGKEDETKLVIAEFVLPLACNTDDGVVDGAVKSLAPPPLLANLGKANASAYWMDLTMQCVFNSQERTLRELVDLALSAGWKVKTVRRGAGSLFSYVVAEP
ncbi:O-methyltransferase, partial [Pterulicium gracile]